MDGSGLPSGRMQRFAAWTNLSETTFCCPLTDEGRAAGADSLVRNSLTGGELPAV